MSHKASALKIIWAFAFKDLKGRFRFRIAIIGGFFQPVLTMASFLVVYASVFLAADTDSLGFVDRNNYVVYLLTAFLAYSVFYLCWGRTSLQGDKIMLTLEGMLLAPVSRVYIMLGKAVQGLMEIMVTVAIFVPLIAVLRPAIDMKALYIGIGALVLLFIIMISFDFMVSALEITSEGWASLIRKYMPRAMLVLGAVYYPSIVIQEYFHPLIYFVYANPLYHATNLFRLAFPVEAELPLGLYFPILYLVGLAILMPIISIVVLEHVMRRWGIKGY